MYIVAPKGCQPDRHLLFADQSVVYEELLSVILFFILILITPIYTYDVDGNRIEDSAIALLIVWSQLDVSDKRFSSKFDKVCFCLFFVLLILNLILVSRL